MKAVPLRSRYPAAVLRPPEMQNPESTAFALVASPGLKSMLANEAKSLVALMLRELSLITQMPPMRIKGRHFCKYIPLSRPPRFACIYTRLIVFKENGNGDDLRLFKP